MRRVKGEMVAYAVSGSQGYLEAGLVTFDLRRVPSHLSSRQMIYRLPALSTPLVAALAVCVLHSSALHAEPRSPQIRYRVAEYVFMNASQIEVHWEYPVFIAGTVGKPDKLNAWVRKQSLQGFEFCFGEGMQDLLRKPDHQIVEFLKNDPDFADCGAVQSVINPTEAFGKIVMVQQFMASSGQARVHHGINSFAFDMKSNAPTEIAALFKPEALAELNDALAEIIAREKPDCRGRSFDWRQVAFRPPDELSIWYPYDPVEWHSCGDGVEALSGTVVSAQLLRPAALRPLRQLRRL